MKYIKEDPSIIDADSADDAEMSLDKLRAQVEAAQQELAAISAQETPIAYAELKTRIAGTLVDLHRGLEAFESAREAFDIFAKHEDWENAVQACDVMVRADQDGSLPALGNGVWLAVTFPIDPELTVLMLNHIVEETPDDSDGAAVAATVAKYIVDVRAQGRQKQDLEFFTSNLLAAVARRHGDVQSQEQFDFWFEKLELNDPAKFLPRLRNVVDVLVQEDWWVDRDRIWASLPDQ